MFLHMLVNSRLNVRVFVNFTVNHMFILQLLLLVSPFSEQLNVPLDLLLRYGRSSGTARIKFILVKSNQVHFAPSRKLLEPILTQFCQSHQQENEFYQLSVKLCARW